MGGVEEEKPKRQEFRTCFDGSQRNSIDLQVLHKRKNGQIKKYSFLIFDNFVFGSVWTPGWWK